MAKASNSAAARVRKKVKRNIAEGVAHVLSLIHICFLTVW